MRLCLFALIVGLCVVQEFQAWLVVPTSYSPYGFYGLRNLLYNPYSLNAKRDNKGVDYKKDTTDYNFSDGALKRDINKLLEIAYRKEAIQNITAAYIRDAATRLRNMKLNSTLCVYIEAAAVLSCKGPTGVVECPTASTINEFGPVKYDLFGIEKTVTDKIRLIPRKLDNTAWVSNVYVKEGVEQSLSLYSKDLYTDLGLTVTDNLCFEKILESIRISPKNERVFVESELADEKSKIFSTTTKTVRIVGELFIVESKKKI